MEETFTDSLLVDAGHSWGHGLEVEAVHAVDGFTGDNIGVGRYVERHVTLLSPE
jgi:hypothetical protein